MIGQSLTQQQQQLLKLSPLQIQVMKLLTQTTQEFNERVEQEIEENPALELEDDRELDMPKSSESRDDDDEKEGDDNTGDDEMDFDHGSNEDFSLGDYVSDDDIPSYQYSDMTEQERRPEMSYQVDDTIMEDLNKQLAMLPNIPDNLREVATYVIGCLSPIGRLDRDIESIIDDFAFIAGKMISPEEVEQALSIVQTLDPAGVGARDSVECLLLQLRRKPQTDSVKLATRILEECGSDLADKRFDKVTKSLGVTDEEFQKAFAVLQKLAPYPFVSREFTDNAVTIIPDFTVHFDDGELVMTLNQGNTPTLQVNNHYATVLEEYAKNRKNQSRSQKEAAMFIKQKVDAAKWFISAVEQRTATMTAVMRAIIDRQRAFFETGDNEQLKPMIMKTIADDTNYDTSTVSRVCNSKYVLTDFGIFPLKYFFTESVETDEGEVHSVAKIKNMISKCVEEEDKRKPLSDQQILEYMKKEGIPLARRTITKYRDQLGIPKAQFRKEF